MKNKLSIIVFILSVVFSYAQVDITPNQLEPVEIEKIISAETTSYFGNSLSFSADGSVLAVGEYGYGTTPTVSRGRVRVYSNETGSWLQKGQDILGIDDSFNTFGKKVELSSDGNTLAVYDSQIGITLNPGQTLQDLFGNLAVEYFPYIQVYQFSNNTWTQVGSDFLFNEIDDYSDMSLSGDGMSLAISTKSSTKVYELVSGTWLITGLEIASGDVLFDDKISLSDDGDTLIIGDPFYSDPNTVEQFSYKGRVKIYQNISNTWTQIGSTINGTDYLGYFGSKVSISADGNTIAIGTDQTNGIDYIAILEFVGGNWVSKGTNIQQIGSTSIISMELSDDGNAIVIGEVNNIRVLKYDTDWEQVNEAIESDVVSDQLGYAVTISGDGNRFAVGAPSIEITAANGYVSIYEYNKNSVTRYGNEIYGYGSYDDLGSGVAVSGDGNTIAVGANGAFGNSGTFGHVRVFEKTTNGLEQIGSDIRNTTDFISGDFGREVALNEDGSILAISAPLLSGSASGAVYIYERNGNIWNPLGNIIYGTYGSRTGSSLAFSDDGSILAVGSGGNPGGVSDDQYTGYTTIYNYNDTNNTWDVLGQQIAGEAEWDFSGGSVDLSGDGTILAIGAIGNDGVTVSGGHGHVRVFEYIGSNWLQKGSDVDGDPAINVNFGGIVTLSHDGNTLIVSDLNYGSGAGSVEIFNWDDTSNNWVSETILVNTITGLNAFGSGTAISDDGNILVIGEYQGFGKTHVYVKDHAGTWIDSHLFLNGTHNGSQNFGRDISLSSNGNTLVVGSRGHNENGTRTGMAALYHLNLCSTIDGFETFDGVIDTPDQPSDNLIVNGSAEILPVTDNGWISVSGNWEWPISNNQGVPVEFGHKYFKTTATGSGELYQDVDVSSLSATIDANNQYFYFSTYLRSFDSSGIDDSQAIVEYRDVSGNVLSTYDTGLSQDTQEWEFFENIRLAPALTRTIRVRLVVTNNGQFGAPNAFIDNVFLSTTSEPAIVSIPDPNFEQHLIDENIDTDGIINAQIQASDAIGITSLIMNNLNISDLTGIEAFTDLEILTAVNNNLTTIDISQNTALTSVILIQNNLTSIDVSNNINLSTLNLTANNVSTLDLSNNTALTILDLTGNSLTSLDTNLLGNLSEFRANNNLLTALDFSLNPNLIQIACASNNLTELNVQNGNNTVISNTFFDATNNPNLTCIQVDDAVYSADTWTSIDPQTSFSVDCNATFINIPDPNFEQALIDDGIDTDGVINAQMLESDALGVTNLNVDAQNISDLTGIEFFTDLETLFANGNNLSSVDLSNNTQLDGLSLGINNLTDIDLSSNTNLVSLVLAQNQLSQVDLSNNTALTQVFVQDNQLTAFDASVLPNLAQLNVSQNELVELDLSQNPALNQLLANNNNLVNLNLQNGNNTNITNASFDATANENLFCIQVDDVNFSQNTWNFTDNQSFFGLDCAPDNDDCIDAQSITLGQDVASTTQSSTSSVNVPGCQNQGLVIIDVWFQFVAPASGSVTLTQDAGTLTLKSALYENCTDLTPIACGTNGLQVDNLTPGQTYFIQTWVEADLSGFLPQSSLTEVGDFTIKVDDTSTLSTFDLNDFEASFKMFPNPAQTYVTLDANQSFDRFEIYSINGQKVLSQSNLSNQNHSVDVSMLSKGIYLIKVSSENSTLTKKLIIR